MTELTPFGTEAAFTTDHKHLVQFNVTFHFLLSSDIEMKVETILQGLIKSKTTDTIKKMVQEFEDINLLFDKQCER